MKNTVLEVHVSEENVETMLFINKAGQYAVRVYDLDAQETFLVVTFPKDDPKSEAQAKQVFEDAIKYNK